LNKNAILFIFVLLVNIFGGCSESTVSTDTETIETADTSSESETFEPTDTTDKSSESETDPADTDDTASETSSQNAPVNLIVTESARYCIAPSEYSATSLQEALAHKAILRVEPGTYPLTEGDFVLPVEVTLRNGTVLSNPVDGVLTTREPPEDSEPTAGYLYGFSQTISDGEGTPFVFGADFGVFQPGDQPPTSYTLDGTQMGYTFGAPLVNESYFRFHYSEPDAATGPVYRMPGFGPCIANDWTGQLNTVQFDGGDITLLLAIGPQFYSTEPAVFPRAYGTLDGVSFDQTDFFRLVYLPEHHHYVQNFAVLFDSPISGACGVMLEGFAPDSPSPVAVYTVDCELSKIETRTIQP
jgi:hypothetical protein